jgi:hypothetical protein
VGVVAVDARSEGPEKLGGDWLLSEAVPFVTFEALEGGGMSGMELGRGAIGALMVPIDAANLGSDRDNLDRTWSPVEPKCKVVELARCIVASGGYASWVPTSRAPGCPLGPIGSVSFAGRWRQRIAAASDVL